MFFFFFNDTATTEIYTLSLHDALPIWSGLGSTSSPTIIARNTFRPSMLRWTRSNGTASLCLPGGVDRKSTRLNSSHSQISYAVFCLKKKINNSRQDDS